MSGHFALGIHAVEQLNATNLNTNEIFADQYPEQQPSPPQQQAQATFPAAQYAFNTKQVPADDNKLPLNNIYAPSQPHHDYQQQIVYQPPAAVYRNQEKHQAPVMYQHVQHPPMIYQYAQQHAPQHINYFYQHKPQDVIYHQQPIASMAHVQEQQQQQQYVVDESQHLLPAARPEENNGNINVELSRVAIPQEINSQDIFLPQVADGVNGNLIQVQPEVTNNVATDNQKLAKFEADNSAHSPENLFQAPIVVGDQQQQQIHFLPRQENQTVVVQQRPVQGPVVFENYQLPQKQYNLQILTDANAASSNHGQYLKEVAPTFINGHTNSNNFQYLVEDEQVLKDSTPAPKSEAPSRHFLKNFKNFRTYEKSSTTQSFSTSTTKTVTKVTSDGECCKNNEKSNCCQNKSEEKVLEITQRPVASNFLAPLYTNVRLTNKKPDDCVDDHKSVVEAHKNVNIVTELPLRTPEYGDRLIFTTPAPRVVTQPIYIERPQHTKFVPQPVFVSTPPTTSVVTEQVYIQSPPETKIVHQPVYIEKAVIKEVQVPVEKPVYINSPPKFIDRPVYIQSPPQTKIVEKLQPVEVEKVVEKFIDRPVYIKSLPETKYVTQQVFVERPVIKEVQVPVEKTVYVKSPPETKIVHQPVYQTVEKIVEKPVIQTIEKPVFIERIVDRPIDKFIDRPYPVPYAVGVPYEKHIYHKPDFHVVAKAIPHKHKLFDFEGLFSFLGKKHEVKHIFVPGSQQHQLKQFGHHQLLTPTLSIESIKESPLVDYSRYATTHLNPIKPIYGVPAAPFQQSAHSGYSYPNPYAGEWFKERLSFENNFIENIF